MRQSVSMSALALSMLFASTSWAEDEPAELSNEQIMLNNQAVEAREAGEFDKAEQLFKAVIQVGEFDFLWMQLGRIYEAQNKCILAKEAYARVEGAPATVDVPHEEVMEKLDSYLRLLENKCSAPVQLDCKTPDMRIKIDDDKEFQCVSQTVMLTPGAHAINAQTSHGSNLIYVDAVAKTPKPVEIEVVNYEKLAVAAGATDEEMEKRSRKYKIAGWTLFGAGVALGVAGGTLYGVSNASYKDDKAFCAKDPLAEKCTNLTSKTNTKYYISYGLLGAGGAALVTGIALLVTDSVTTKRWKEGTAYNNFVITPYVSPESAGLGMTYTF